METTIIIAANIVMSVVVIVAVTLLAMASRFRPPGGGQGRADWRGPLRLDLSSA